MHSLGIVQWNSTRRDHPRNPGGVSGSGLVTVVQRTARREPLPLLVLALGNTIEGLEGRAICCELFFNEINLDKSLGIDSNCILVALFRLFFFFFCNLYELSLCSRGIPNPYNWYQS